MPPLFLFAGLVAWFVLCCVFLLFIVHEKVEGIRPPSTHLSTPARKGITIFLRVQL